MTTSPEEKRKIIGDTFVKVISIILFFHMDSRYVFYLRLFHSEALCAQQHSAG